MNRRFIAVLIKETREIWRDPYTLGMAIGLPFVMLLLFAYSTNLDVKNMSLAVFDQDKSALSRLYITQFTTDDTFYLKGYASSYDELNQWMENDTVDTALVIPPNFGQTLAARRPETVQIWVDGSFPPTANVAINYMQAFNARFNYAQLAAIVGEQNLKPAIDVQPSVWFNPGLKSINYVVPGLYAVILLAFPPLLSALSIVKEKEQGSIQQVFVSPIRSAELILGKLIPYGVIAFIEMLVILAMGIWGFRVPFEGSIWLLLFAALIYVFGAVGIGLLVSTVTETQVAAMLAAIVLTMMPALIFSGFIYPIFNMPEIMQWYTYLFPARHFVDISRSIVLKGADLRTLWFQMGLMIAYVAAIFAIAALRFKKKVG